MCKSGVRLDLSNHRLVKYEFDLKVVRYKFPVKTEGDVMEDVSPDNYATTPYQNNNTMDDKSPLDVSLAKVDQSNVNFLQQNNINNNNQNHGRDQEEIVDNGNNGVNKGISRNDVRSY